MADKKCGLRYCGATVADYDEIVNVIKCPCIKCLGVNCDTCAMYGRRIKTGLDMQKQKCQKCKFYKGR